MNKSANPDMEYQDAGLNDDSPSKSVKELLPENKVPFLDAVIRFFTLGIPSMIAVFSMMILGTSNQIIIGQLGDPTLNAAVGLGNMIMNVFCLSVGMGMNGALDTLVS